MSFVVVQICGVVPSMVRQFLKRTAAQCVSSLWVIASPMHTLCYMQLHWLALRLYAVQSARGAH